MADVKTVSQNRGDERLIKMEVINARQTAERYMSASKSVDTEFRIAMDDMGKFGLRVLQRKVNVKTGKLRDSMKYELQRTSLGYKIVFHADATAVSDSSYYVNYVDRGTRPHTIRVRNKRALHFFDRNGNERFAQAVYHPGYKGSHFTNKSIPEIEQHVTTVSRKLLASIAKKVSA